MDTTSVSPLARRVFSSTNVPLANGVDTAAPVLGIDFVPAPTGTAAGNTPLGAGCIQVDDLSFYESFTTSAAFDLGFSGISLLRTPDGYLAVPLTRTFVPPSGVAQTVGASALVLLTDVPGVLDGGKRVIPELDRARIDALIASGVIAGGMVPKVKAAVPLWLPRLLLGPLTVMLPAPGPARMLAATLLSALRT
jgi:hypothetical protein